MSLLKIYGPDRQALFSMEAAETGNVEDKPALNDALERGARKVAHENAQAVGTHFVLAAITTHSGGRLGT